MSFREPKWLFTYRMLKVKEPNKEESLFDQEHNMLLA